MKYSILVLLTATLSSTVAEEVSLCVTHCLSEGAGVAGCISYVDYKCTCSSPAFKDTVTTCLTDACTKADIEAAGQLHEEVCGTSPE